MPYPSPPGTPGGEGRGEGGQNPSKNQRATQTNFMAKHPGQIDRARELRQSDVPAEEILWKQLRNRGLGGFKFRRHIPIGPFFGDFVCVECKIVIELDGLSHLDSQRNDQSRSELLQAKGWRVLRYWNSDVFDNLEAVKEAIYLACLQRKPGN